MAEEEEEEAVEAPVTIEQLYNEETEKEAEDQAWIRTEKFERYYRDKVLLADHPLWQPQRQAETNFESMAPDDRADWQIEANAVVSEVLKTYSTNDKVIDAFLRWVEVRWTDFWSRFQPDGKMSWREFEQFVEWENRWQGDVRRVFAILDPTSTGYVSKPFILETKRKWHLAKDAATSNIDDFKWKLSNHWGTLGRAWRLSLDPQDTGHCPQGHFIREVTSIGLTRNLKTIWTKLTRGEIQRSLVLRDLDPEIDKVLKDFVLGLVQRHGDLREGWCSVCRAGGGHLHEPGLISACSSLGIDAKSAKALFAVLDPKQKRYFTEYDKLDFLEIWNPGNQIGGINNKAAAEAIAKQELDTKKTIDNLASRIQSSLNLDPFDQGVGKMGHFEFSITLTKDEYAEYLRRRRTARISAGLKGSIVIQEVGTKKMKKPPLGGYKPRPPGAPVKLSKSKSGPITPRSNPSTPRSKHQVNDEVNLWRALAPKSLGSNNGSTSRKDNASTLGKLLTYPLTTGY